MYYEEKMINGVMHYRRHPDDAFTPYTLEALSKRYEVAKTHSVELQEQIKILREALEYYEMWDRSEDEGTTARVALAATEPKE